MVKSPSRLAGLIAAVLAAGTLARPALAATDLTSFSERVLTLVNQQRAARGLQPLSRVSALDRAAQDYAVRMASQSFFAHTAPDGSGPGDRIQAAGYSGFTWGENIAAGQDSPEAVMTSWMNSPGHAANILNTSFKNIGIGAAVGGNFGIYWVQDFGATNGALPAPSLPQLNQVSPAAAGVGSLVTLDGTNLGSPGGVSFGGVPAVVEEWSTSRVVARVPAADGGGPVVLTNVYGSSNGVTLGGTSVPPPPPSFVTNPPPSSTPPATGPASTPTPASTVAPARLSGKPHFSGVSPKEGPTGTIVHLKGSHFGPQAGRVSISGAAATVISWSDSDIVVQITGSKKGKKGLRIVRSDGRKSESHSFKLTR